MIQSWKYTWLIKDNVPEQKQRFGCLMPQSQTHETGAGAKGNRFIQVLHDLSERVDSHLKDHLLFLLKPAVLIEIGDRGFPPAIHSFSSFLHVLGPYPFIFLSFGTHSPIHSHLLLSRQAHCKTMTILANGEDSPGLWLTGYKTVTLLSSKKVGIFSIEVMGW